MQQKLVIKFANQIIGFGITRSCEYNNKRSQNPINAKILFFKFI